MEKRLQKGALNDACRRVAEGVLWTQAGTSADLVETLAHKLQAVAEHHEYFIVEQGKDPNVITRATSYIAHVHAVPMMASESVQWFNGLLSGLIELAVPNSVVSKDLFPFFEDIRRGIETAEVDANG